MKGLVRLCCAAIAAAGCINPTGPAGDATGANPNTYDVQVDGKSSTLNLGAFTYFPKEIQVHPGDTVRFTSVDRGEPHTVTFGALVDDLAATMAKAPKDAPPPPDLLKEYVEKAGHVPQLLVGKGGNYDFNPAAGQPCFLARGEPAKNAPCPKDQQTPQPEFTGTQPFFNSGYMPDRAVFALRLAQSVKPGIYNYICLFHFGGMSGRVVVVDKEQPVPSPEAVKTKSAQELAKLVEAMKPAADAAETKTTPGTVVAGTGVAKNHDGFVLSFFPRVVTVQVGGSVTWQIVAGHTISFNAPPDATDLAVKAVDGTFHLNLKALLPANSPAIPLPEVGEVSAAPPPPAEPARVDGGVWDGRGFKSSGLIFSSTTNLEPPFSTYTVTFAQPGTYNYRCLIHLDMEGTVKVGE